MEYVRKIDSDDEAYLKMVKAPIIRDGCMAAKCLEEDYLSDFLYRICSQEPERAIRRNRVYIGKHYEDEAKLHEKIDRVLRLPRRAVRGIRNRVQK